uniref:Lipocalin n=1 Tax=Rhipicephalus sanguineus TaxID=34632 RepID=C9W1P2_RHISA
MATFIALMFSALAVAEASLDLHEFVKNPDLSKYQDPQSDYRSTNITLTVKSEVFQTLLNVDHKGGNFSIMNLTGEEFAISSANYTFLVLFSDSNCLILARTLQTAKIKRNWLQCFMWLPEHRITKPPKCCQFVFELLCAYMVDTVEFFDQSCLNATARSSNST